MPGATVKVVRDGLHIHTPYSEENARLCRNIPQRRWLKAARVWACRPSLANMEYIAKAFPDAHWDDASIKLFSTAQGEDRQRKRTRSINSDKLDVRLDLLQKEIKLGLFRTPLPWDHILKALAMGRDLSEFAYFMDQGTGKSRTYTEDCAHNYRRGRVNGSLLFAPNDVKLNWVADDGGSDVISEWGAPDIRWNKMVWESDPTAAQRRAFEEFWERGVIDREDGVFFLAANYEASRMDRAMKMFREFCERRQIMIGADESTAIGAPGSDQTKALVKLRALCPVARILTGTPIVKSPLKAYSQLGFLSEDILGFGSFYSFKARYSVMGGYKGRQVLKHINLDELSNRIASCSFRVTKDECLDLPPKVYVQRRVYMTPEQERAYAEMKDRMLATFDDQTVSARIKLTQAMRFQQITGGYAKDEEGKTVEIIPPSRNPIMQDVLQVLSERGDQRFIIWAHWRDEVEALTKLLIKNDYNIASFYGGVDKKDRMAIRRAFEAGEYDGIVANQATGGKGIDEFKGASLVLYYSNSEHTENRIQSEDRTHRGGSEIHDKITYVDWTIPNTVRVKMIRTLRNNKNLSDEIMRDGLRSWI